MQRYFAPVINAVVVIIIDGSRLERLLYGKISERSYTVLHTEIGTAAQYRMGKRRARSGPLSNTATAVTN